jgi:hypothetical protein
MDASDFLLANFTISDAAKCAAEDLRVEYDARFPEDPAAILSIGWGYVEGTDPLSGRVVVSFYPRSMGDEVTHGIQEVSHVKVIFFITERFHPLFEGKVLDHSDERGFFLREP